MKKYLFNIVCILLLSSSYVDAQLKSTQVCDCEYDGYIARVDMVSSIKVDEKRSVYVEAINKGTCYWSRYDVELVVIVARGPSGSRIQKDELVPSDDLQISSKILKGGSAKFYYDITGPTYLGDYTIEFNLKYKGTKFGDGLKKYIKVVAK